jgi:hypothetical protein
MLARVAAEYQTPPEGRIGYAQAALHFRQ